jgi:hypothetical protein
MPAFAGMTWLGAGGDFARAAMIARPIVAEARWLVGPGGDAWRGCGVAAAIARPIVAEAKRLVGFLPGPEHVRGG